jgi:hypothetical protein
VDLELVDQNLAAGAQVGGHSSAIVSGK